MTVFCFVKNCQAVFQSGFNIFHLDQQSIRVSHCLICSSVLVIVNVLDFSHSERYTLLFLCNLQFLNVRWYEYFCVTFFYNLSSLVEIFSLFLNWVILLISSFIGPLHILFTSVYKHDFFQIFSLSLWHIILFCGQCLLESRFLTFMFHIKNHCHLQVHLNFFLCILFF